MGLRPQYICFPGDTIQPITLPNSGLSPRSAKILLDSTNVSSPPPPSPQPHHLSLLSDSFPYYSLSVIHSYPNRGPSRLVSVHRAHSTSAPLHLLSPLSEKVFPLVLCMHFFITFFLSFISWLKDHLGKPFSGPIT